MKNVNEETMSCLCVWVVSIAVGVITIKAIVNLYQCWFGGVQCL